MISLKKLMTTSCLLLMAAVGSTAHAARPLNTDDANVVDPQSCQDESWVKKSKTSIERWIVPGCNFLPILKFLWVPIFNRTQAKPVVNFI